MSDDPPPEEENFQKLASGMLLTDLVQGARDEVRLRSNSDGREDDYPILAQLWLAADGAARATLRRLPTEFAASSFMARWRTLDLRHGDPLSRSWWLTYVEAFRRQQIVMDYLYDSGLTGFREAEKTSPRYWLSKKELEGE